MTQPLWVGPSWAVLAVLSIALGCASGRRETPSAVAAAVSAMCRSLVRRLMGRNTGDQVARSDRR